MKKVIFVLFASASLVFAFNLGNFAKSVMGSSSSSSTVTSGLNNATIASGLKEALKKGVSFAAQKLGKNGGYLNNSLVKIPLPKNLSKVEKLVRKFGGDRVADELIDSMNSAASKAAPKTVKIFMNAIDNMSLNDAKKILTGDKNAATQYFKSHTSKSLEKMIAPIVQNTMKNNSVAKYYDAFNSYYDKYGKKYVQNSNILSLAKSFGADSYLPSGKKEDLNKYVTQKAIDGLFKMIAKEEANIRENPVARTTSLLKKVFN